MPSRWHRRGALVLLLTVASCGGGAVATTAAFSGETTTSTTSTSTTTSTRTTTTTLPPSTTTTLVDEELLIGVWVAPNHGVLITFDGEGNHFVSYFDGEPFDFGPYLLEGNILTFVSGEGQEVCTDGSTGMYEIAITADGQEVHADVVSDGCTERRNAMITVPLRRWSNLPDQEA